MRLRLLTGFALFSTLLFAVCCGGQATDQEEQMNGEQLGDAIVDLFIQALGDVVDVLKTETDEETITSTLQAKKEEYIEQFVALGRQREALSESERETADSVTLSGVVSRSGELYDEFLELWQPYQGTELGNLIAGFNIITVYANFDLLREQFPEEAERLGID